MLKLMFVVPAWESMAPPAPAVFIIKELFVMLMLPAGVVLVQMAPPLSARF